MAASSDLPAWLERYSVSRGGIADLNRICWDSLDLFMTLPDVLIGRLCSASDVTQCLALKRFVVQSKTVVAEFFPSYDEAGPVHRADMCPLSH